MSLRSLFSAFGDGQQESLHLFDMFQFLVQLDNSDFEIISRRENLGESFNFDDSVRDIKILVETLSRISFDDLQRYGQSPDAFDESFRKILSNVFAILQFSPRGDTPEKDAEALKSNLQKSIRAILPRLATVVTLSQNERQSEIEGELQERFESFLEERAREATELRERLIKAEDSLSRSEERARKAAEVAEEAAGVASISEQSIFFDGQASRHKYNERLWLAMLALTAMVFFASIFLFDDVFSSSPSVLHPDLPQTWIYASTKFLFFGALIYLSSISKKNYFVCIHNRLINEHRSNALKTFEALVRSANTERARDLALTAAANCIFSHQDPGAIRTSPGQDAAAPPPQIVVNTPA
ncbi:MAG: hypothetical protein AAGF76_11810 [Pseudomonadota bacterium]